MAITYAAGTNLITLDDEVGAGDSWANAYDMEDVLAADVAGAWSVVTKQGADAYDVSARMSFAAGVYFVSINEFVELKPNPTNPTYGITSAAGSHIRFGEYDATDKFSYNGSLWKMYLGATTGTRLNKFYGETLIYNSKWWTDSTAYQDSWNFNGTTRIYDSIISGLAYFNVADIDIQNIVWDGPGFAMILAYGFNFNWKSITVSSTSYGLYLSNAATADATVYDVVFKGCTIDALAADVGSLLIVVNSPTLSTPSVNSGCAGIKECYTFDIKVTEENGTTIEGVTVTLKDTNGNDTFTPETTNASGTLSSQKIITKRWVRHANEGGTINYNNHTLKLRKTGTSFLTYERTFTLGEAIDWEIAMVDVSDIVNGITDIKGTGFVKDTDSLVDIRPETDKIQTGIIDTPNNFKADVTNLDVAVSTRSSPSDVLADINKKVPADLEDVPTDSELDTSHGSGSWEGASASSVASAVWDEDLSGHTTPNTAGKIVSTIKKIVSFIRTNT